LTLFLFLSLLKYLIKSILNMHFQEDYQIPEAQASGSVLPAYLFDPNYQAKVDIDLSNIVFLKRRMVETDRNTHLPVLVCFCKDAAGCQLPALKKTSRTYACHFANTKGTRKCGFRIGATTLAYLHEYQLLKSDEPMNMPVCKTCGGSWLLHSSNAKIKDQLGNLQYICNCDPYSAKINVPIDHETVSYSFDLNNYAKAQKAMKANNGNPTTALAFTSEIYIPDN